MSVSIKGGNNGNEVDVNDEKELVTRSIVETELEHASATNGDGYTWNSLELDIDAGDTMLFVKNTSDTPLILDRAEINGSNVACIWEILIGAETTTPSGTTVIGANMNGIFSSTTASVTALSDETAVSDGTNLFTIKTEVAKTKSLNLDGIILGKNHYIQFNQETESTSGSVILVGHYTNPS